MSIPIKSLLAIMACVVFAQSCKKNDESAVGSATAKVKTYIEQVTNFSTTSGDTFHVSYDNNNRVVSLIALSSGNQFLYTYNGNSNYILEIKKGTHLNIHEVAYINNSLLTDSTFQYNDTNDSTTMKFVYNSNNQVVELKEYNYTLSKGAVLFRRETYTYNAEGNVLSHSELGPSGTINFTETYTYTNFWGNNFGYGAPFAPLLYKKLPLTISAYYPGYNQTVVSNFTYVFDNYNRVIKETQINSGNNSLIKQYEYY